MIINLSPTLNYIIYNYNIMKNNRWAFTSPTQPTINLKFVSYLVYQEETGERSGYKHYQGYIEFHKEYTLQYVKSLFKSKQIHLEIAVQSREVNTLYCTKIDTRTGVCLMYNSKTDTDIIDYQAPQLPEW